MFSGPSPSFGNPKEINRHLLAPFEPALRCNRRQRLLEYLPAIAPRSGSKYAAHMPVSFFRITLTSKGEKDRLASGAAVLPAGEFLFSDTCFKVPGNGLFLIAVAHAHAAAFGAAQRLGLGGIGQRIDFQMLFEKPRLEFGAFCRMRSSR